VVVFTDVHQILGCKSRTNGAGCPIPAAGDEGCYAAGTQDVLRPSVQPPLLAAKTDAA
jgi:hypothetical protein